MNSKVVRSLRVLQYPLLVVGIIVSLTGICCVIFGVCSSGWQIMDDLTTGQLHQHGLFIDYTYAKLHTGSGEYQWISNLKFGDYVRGDPAHQAQSFQINTLIVLCIAIVVAVIGCLSSCCTKCFLCASLCWTVCMFLATVLCTTGLVIFYMAAVLPEQRFVFFEARNEQIIGYAFWCTFGGDCCFGFSMIFAIINAGIMCKTRKDYDERPPPPPMKHLSLNRHSTQI